MRGSAGPASSTLELLAEDAARAFLEHFRWPNGPVCPHCGWLGAYRLHPTARSTAPVRNGVLKCKACRRQFTVTVGTAFEHSHVPLSTWLVVIRRLCESGQALSAYQLHKLVGVSRQSAWLMAQRIREAIALRAGTRHADPLRLLSAQLACVLRDTTFSSRLPTRRLSLTGIPYEEVLASMIERKPPATVKAQNKRKWGAGNRQAGKRAPDERKLIA